MAKKREINEYRQVKDSVYKIPSSHKEVYHKSEMEVRTFIEEMVKKHPNYYNLGQAIHRYYTNNIQKIK